jgi:hypothetical protein
VQHGYARKNIYQAIEFYALLKNIFQEKSRGKQQNNGGIKHKIGREAEEPK